MIELTIFQFYALAIGMANIGLFNWWAIDEQDPKYFAWSVMCVIVILLSFWL